MLCFDLCVALHYSVFVAAIYGICFSHVSSISHFICFMVCCVLCAVCCRGRGAGWHRDAGYISPGAGPDRSGASQAHQEPGMHAAAAGRVTVTVIVVVIVIVVVTMAVTVVTIIL